MGVSLVIAHANSARSLPDTPYIHLIAAVLLQKVLTSCVAELRALAVTSLAYAHDDTARCRWDYVISRSRLRSCAAMLSARPCIAAMLSHSLKLSKLVSRCDCDAAAC